MKNNKILMILIFTILGLICLQIPFSQVLGSNTKFTLFDFFAPSIGSFIGSIPGIISVLLMQVVNYLLHGKNFDLGGIIRIFPTLFAVSYFAKKRAVNILIPVLAIVAFNLHPIGRSAWQYSMFWLIPIAANFFRKNLFIRSLGTTFTAHGVGSALWIWVFGLSREMWLALIPQTAIERILMAAGISAFYLLFVEILTFAAKRKLLPALFDLKKPYLLN